MTGPGVAALGVGARAARWRRGRSPVAAGRGSGRPVGRRRVPDLPRRPSSRRAPPTARGRGARRRAARLRPRRRRRASTATRASSPICRTPRGSRRSAARPATPAPTPPSPAAPTAGAGTARRLRRLPRHARRQARAARTGAGRLPLLPRARSSREYQGSVHGMALARRRPRGLDLPGLPRPRARRAARTATPARPSAARNLAADLRPLPRRPRAHDPAQDHHPRGLRALHGERARALGRTPRRPPATTATRATTCAAPPTRRRPSTAPTSRPPAAAATRARRASYGTGVHGTAAGARRDRLARSAPTATAST